MQLSLRGLAPTQKASALRTSPGYISSVGSSGRNLEFRGQVSGPRA